MDADPSPDDEDDAPQKSEVVVKAGVNAVLLHSNLIAPFIHKRVVMASKRWKRATILFNAMLLDAFDGHIDVCKAVLPSNINQTFFYQLLVGQENAVKPVLEITAFLHKHAKTIPLKDEIERYPYDRNIYAYLAKMMGTNFKNYTMTTFLQRQKDFVKWWCKKNNLGVFYGYILYNINGWTIKSLPKDFPEVPRLVTDFISSQRRILNPQGEKIGGKKWGAIHWQRVVRFYVHVLRRYEKHEKSLFTLAPIGQTKRIHIPIDKSSFIGILKEAGLFDKQVDEMTAMKNSLRLSKYETKTKSFTGLIHTDGFSCCVHFEKLSDKNVSVHMGRDKEASRVLAIDPGRKNILYVVEKQKDGYYRSIKLTRSEYYDKLGHRISSKETKKWSKSIESSLKKLSESSPKGSNINKFYNYMAVYETTSSALWNEYLKKRWALRRFLQNGKKKKIIDRFITEKIGIGNEDERRNTIVAFGDGKFAPTGTGERPVPRGSVAKRLGLYFKVYGVDEYRTTTLCCSCNQRLWSVKEQASDGRVSEVRGLRWCNTPDQCCKFLDRDLNAAINIWNIYMSTKRPSPFCRGPLEQLCSIPKKSITIATWRRR